MSAAPTVATRPVVIAAGGTGGHVVPALAVADVLRAREIPVVWFGTRAGLEARLVPAAGIEMRWIEVAALRGKGLGRALAAPFALARASWRCARLMRPLRPRAVLGMGGFVAGPVGLAAAAQRLPLVLHEQNAIAGLTNRVLARVATRVLAAWPQSFGGKAGVATVGNPVRREIAALAAARRAASTAADGEADAGAAIDAGASMPGTATRPLRLLVIGGSRGARALNERVPEALARLGGRVAVHHQSGAADADAVRARYAALGVANARVESFVDDMAAAYAAADLVVCRSGAMTVTELAALGMPSILVPFPHAVDDHQTANARALVDVGGAVLMPQASLDAVSLAAAIDRLEGERAALAAMGRAARGAYRAGAAEAVAAAVVEVAANGGAARPGAVEVPR